MPTNHLAIQARTTLLPVPVTGDIDFQQNFDLPDVNVAADPFLSYRVNPTDATRVQLQIDLNGRLIVDEIFTSGVSRSFNEIFDASVLMPVGNILTVTRQNGAINPGSFEISNLIMVYSAN